MVPHRVKGAQPVAKGRAHFSNHELAVVLSHYDIGVIQSLRSLSAGNPQAPKTVIVSDKGLFIIKRRPHGKDDPHRVSLAHAIRLHLQKNGYPVAAMVRTREHGHTFVKSHDHIYELFEYVRGTRYDGSPEATLDAGRRLAEFHMGLAEFTSEYKPALRSFHDSEAVRCHIKAIGPAHAGNGIAELHEVTGELLRMYDAAAARVNGLGLGKWPEKFTHGDWHPGNIMFEGHNVRVVLDLDSVKLAPAPTDLANGLLQFSIVAGKPDPADWPDSLDTDRLTSFMCGYRQVVYTQDCEAMLPDLMIETMIAEAILPVAATGSFGHMSGLDFLKMIRRKCAWIQANSVSLLDAMKDG
jgi:Ser/Thr protein kinase RdoA (MazF antagonist)